MAGTKEGGRKAAQTNRKKYGPDFYENIGKIGGKNGRTGGFYANRELAAIAGAKGGRISRRRPSEVRSTDIIAAAPTKQSIISRVLHIGVKHG